MANIDRILGKCIGGGPLDGNYFSVPAEQTEIYGFGDMPPGSAYVKLGDRTRAFTGEEKGLVDLLFDTDQHDLSQICEFIYEENASAPSVEVVTDENSA